MFKSDSTIANSPVSQFRKRSNRDRRKSIGRALVRFLCSAHGQKNGKLSSSLCSFITLECPVSAHPMEGRNSVSENPYRLHITKGYRPTNDSPEIGDQAILKCCRMAAIRSALFNLLFPNVVFNEPRIEVHSELSSGKAARNVLRSCSMACASRVVDSPERVAPRRKTSVRC